MKLAVTVLASILAICSVTTASPVNPSAAASAGASTSTVIPSAQVTLSVDLSKLSEEDMDLIKEYAHIKKACNDEEKIHDSLQSEKLEQKEALDELAEEQWDPDFLDLKWRLGEIETLLLERLFKGNMDQPIEYYMQFLETDSEFLELADTLFNSPPVQQPRSEQASTSGTQSP
ncbi:hypothetical protein O5D80_002246 [Batrachochytrium dendrobatidis]|nr:hypothetical protein O5D80_002246 [Batrachochytrium dendrobatidis]